MGLDYRPPVEVFRWGVDLPAATALFLHVPICIHLAVSHAGETSKRKLETYDDWRRNKLIRTEILRARNLEKLCGVGDGMALSDGFY